MKRRGWDLRYQLCLLSCMVYLMHPGWQILSIFYLNFLKYTESRLSQRWNAEVFFLLCLKFIWWAKITRLCLIPKLQDCIPGILSRDISESSSFYLNILTAGDSESHTVFCNRLMTFRSLFLWKSNPCQADYISETEKPTDYSVE